MSEHDSLRELVRDLLGDQTETSPDSSSSLWTRFEEAGLPSVGVAESAGGSGGTAAELAVIVETAGGFGAGVPIIETSIARWILAEANSSELFEGFITAGLVELTESDLLTRAPLSVPAIAWGRHADHVILCPIQGRPVVISTADAGVAVEPKVDISGFPKDTITVAADAGRVIVEHPPAADVILARFAVLRAAALTGAITATYELTRNYVRTREQFGAPLVTIPAVASGVATVRTKVLEASAALKAAIPNTSEDGAAQRVLSAFAARVVAARCASDTARLAHQLHGAIGTTAEYPLHRLTTALWAWRDADLGELAWAQMLGARAITQGEASMWAEIRASAS